MATTAQQLDDLDTLLSGMEGIDELEALDFETEEIEEPTDENEALAAAQEEIEAEIEQEEAVADDDLDALLADDAEHEAPQSEPDTEVDLEAVEASVKAEERQRRLEEASMTDEEAAEAKAKSLATEAKEKVESVKKAKSAPRDAINVSETLESKLGLAESHWKLLPGTPAEELRGQILERCDSLPKKTREKVVNLMDWWVRGHSLSVYTRIGFEQLIEEGELVGVALRNRYMSNPGKSYTLGTANAQSGQIVKLFKAFFITAEDGTLNEEHAMVKRFKEIHGL